MKLSISALLVSLTLLLGSVSSAATDQVDLSWSAASGSVVEYAVFVARNGAPLPNVPDQMVNDTRATLLGNAGDVIVVQVAGVNDSGMQGPLSDPSDPYQFPVPPPPDPTPPPSDPPPPDPTPPPSEPPPPDPTPPPSEPPPDDPDRPTEDPPALPPASGDALYFEDFEGYGDGADPEGWLDTAAKNSMREDPGLFETFELTDGTLAFGTSSTETNIHSHLDLAGSSDWSGYELSGLLSTDHRRGGIGVTLYSDYPNSRSYYRLRREGTNGPFQLSPQGLSASACVGTTDTGVVPRPGSWYRFRFRALPESGGTRVQARVWEEGAAEPAAWQADCLDPDARFEAGRPGVWSKGPGTKLWDELAVEEVGD